MDDIKHCQAKNTHMNRGRPSPSISSTFTVAQTAQTWESQGAVVSSEDIASGSWPKKSNILWIGWNLINWHQWNQSILHICMLRGPFVQLHVVSVWSVPPTPRAEISIAGATQPLTIVQCGNIQGQEMRISTGTCKRTAVSGGVLSKYAYRMLFSCQAGLKHRHKSMLWLGRMPLYGTVLFVAFLTRIG